MKPFIVSWSKLKDFLVCPQKFWLLHGSKHVLGEAIISFNDNKYTIEGTKKHEVIKGALISLKHEYKITKACQENALWKPWWLDVLNNLAARWPHFFLEHKIGLDTELRGWSLDEQYWQPDAACFGNRQMLLRAGLDFIGFKTSPFCDQSKPTEVLLVDWKSGKTRKDTKYGQLAFYAFVVFCHWPFLTDVTTTYIFIDQKQKQTMKFIKQECFEDLKKVFLQQINDLQHVLQYREIPQRASQDCRWCPAEKKHCYYACK